MLLVNSELNPTIGIANSESQPVIASGAIGGKRLISTVLHAQPQALINNHMMLCQCVSSGLPVRIITPKNATTTPAICR